MVNPKHTKPLRKNTEARLRKNTEAKPKRVVINMPEDLLFEVRAYAARRGEVGPSPMIQRAVVDYMKRNPRLANAL